MSVMGRVQTSAEVFWPKSGTDARPVTQGERVLITAPARSSDRLSGTHTGRLSGLNVQR